MQKICIQFEVKDSIGLNSTELAQFVAEIYIENGQMKKHRQN